jgi:glycerol-3-phosphate acyltransferase PlsY
MIATALLSVSLGYLLGSIPSAYLVGRLLKGVDLRDVGDGRIGTSAAFRRLGKLGGTMVGIADFGKGVAAIMLARLLGVSEVVVLLSGLAAVIGHDWSIFIHLKGGKGAATTYGVLASVMAWQLLIALGIAGMVFFISHKSGLSTGIMFGILPPIVWACGASALLVVFPILLSTPMVLKHLSMARVKVADLK